MRISKDVFLLAHGGLLILLLLIQLQFSQLEISLWVNQRNSLILDFVCLYGTYLGDGLLVFVACVILYFFKPRLAIMILLSYASSALITQGFKHWIFDDMNRPMWFIEHWKLNGYHLVKGAEETYRNSFPSGHSTSAFAVFSCLALFAYSKQLKLFIYILAVFIAFTRIYLLQHFLMDTCAGSIIGILCSYVIYYFLYERGKLEALFNKIST